VNHMVHALFEKLLYDPQKKKNISEDIRMKH
jgi:hypothetical protein